jgi:hypothetical protein
MLLWRWYDDVGMPSTRAIPSEEAWQLSWLMHLSGLLREQFPDLMTLSSLYAAGVRE